MCWWSAKRWDAALFHVLFGVEPWCTNAKLKSMWLMCAPIYKWNVLIRKLDALRQCGGVSSVHTCMDAQRVLSIAQLSGIGCQGTLVYFGYIISRLLGEKRPFLLPPSCLCCRNVSRVAIGATHGRKNHSQICLLNYHTQQFDLAITARDQSVLEAGSRVCDRTRGALRSVITKLYPALPMTSTLYPHW